MLGFTTIPLDHAPYQLTYIIHTSHTLHTIIPTYVKIPDSPWNGRTDIIIIQEKAFL
jgi:hypothetical protein